MHKESVTRACHLGHRPRLNQAQRAPLSGRNGKQSCQHQGESLFLN